MLGILWKSVRTACYLAFVQNYALNTQKREVLYVLLLNKNNELSGYMAVNYKYLFLRAINTEEEDVIEVIEIRSYINSSESITLELRLEFHPKISVRFPVSEETMRSSVYEHR